MIIVNQLKREEEEFDEKFYEGDRNSVFCKAHNVFATPKEIKQFHKESYIRLLESVLEELPGKVRMLDEKENKYFKKYGFSENNFVTGHNQCAIRTKSIILKSINNIKGK